MRSTLQPKGSSPFIITSWQPASSGVFDRRAIRSLASSSVFDMLKQLSVGGFIEAQAEQGAILDQYRALDDRGFCHHQLNGGRIVDNARFGLIIKAAPGHAGAIDEFFPGSMLEPVFKRGSIDALFLEIMEFIRDAVLIQPGSSFFHCVAIGDAVKFHEM